MDNNLAKKELIKLAKRAYRNGEVPVGAFVVNENDQIIGRGANKTHQTKDGLMHAELIAIRQAEKRLGDWRLKGCTLYVTLEPCLMCLGAIGNSRIDRVVYVLKDPLFGSVASKLSTAQVKKMYPKLKVEKLRGEEEVAELMTSFFKDLRTREKKFRMGANN